MTLITRRNLIVTGAVGLLTGCDAITSNPTAQEVMAGGGGLHKDFHRILGGRTGLAREFRQDQISPKFRINGNGDPGTPEYAAMAANHFADWRLQVHGLVQRPLSISLAQLQQMPQRAQITRHDCVEGWSAIGKWQGPQLSGLLQLAGLRERAKYIVFHCADSNRGGTVPYYESIDLVDALHPQTILAWAMNDHPLHIGHGAPLRLRVERQLGYKQAKYVMAVEAVESLAAIGRGMGGYWEDWAGYEWYAGI